MLFCRIAWSLILVLGGSFALLDRSFFGDNAGAILLGRAGLMSLIVDDEPINLLVLKGMLAFYDLDLREARDGQEAIDIELDWQPDLILMDVHMPVLDGVEATRQIASRRHPPPPPVVAVTGSIFEFTDGTIDRAGFAEVLQKPLQTQDLDRVLGSHFGEDSEPDDPRD